MSTFELHSWLSRDECVRRLERGVDPVWRIRGDRPLNGMVGHSWCWFYQRANRRNPFALVLSARLSDKDGGTRIHGRLGIARLAQIAIIACALIVPYAIASGRPIKLGLLIFLCAYLGVHGWSAFRRWNEDKKYLIEVLRNRLGAR